VLVHLDKSTIRGTRWYEYFLRFFFGGLITAIAGIIAKKFGPVIAGLFLAFPAIFPASATLVEKHEKQKKEEKGLHGEERGREVVALEATGTALGSVGLVLFAGVVWLLLPHQNSWIVLSAATFAWAAGSVGVWILRMKL
jgi:hypothetical protein